MEAIINLLTRRVNYLKEQLQFLNEKVKNEPAGLLRISGRKDHPQFYFRDGNSSEREIYIPKSKNEFACQLAQKGYYLDLIDVINRELKSLELLLKQYPEIDFEMVYQSLGEMRKSMVKPLIDPIDVFVEKWQSKPYVGLPFKKDDPAYKTNRGEMVRSKSELILANTFNDQRVPYKFECPITLSSGVCYPDFTILNVRTRKEYYWEHFGKMDDQEYSGRVAQKITEYEGNGIFPGDNLIITMESKSSPLNFSVIMSLINRYAR